MNEPEPAGYDGHGAPLWPWSIGDRLDDDTRRRLTETIDSDQA
jgi:hypothetical protein